MDSVITLSEQLGRREERLTGRKYLMNLDAKCLQIVNGFHSKIPFTTEEDSKSN